MSKVIVSAKNLDLALIKASGELAIARDDVKHKIKEESTGFCGFGKKVVIEAWDRRSKTSKPQRSRKKERSKFAVVDDQLWQSLAMELQEYLQTILLHGFGVRAEIATKRENLLREERMVLDIDSQFVSDIFEENMRLPESFEHILRKKPRHIKRELPFKIFIDACSMRKKREQELMKLAHSMSEKVCKTHKSMVLDYESSYDRKVIHLALDNDDRVYTRSVGRGVKRRLIIAPARQS
ncbi:MAG: Jag N-terminal domain-containing protein [Proteobacteria bacterium]|nr:Jag N-terminal domain-containing protein [Pseudomonadota bacterium]